jgi:uncharacterized protein YbjQ (UPF0145 family)
MFEGERNKVIASTLHALPGATIVECKPMIWASFTQTHHGYDQATAGKSVAYLFQKCQAELLERTIEVGCNAVLGVTYNVTNDSAQWAKHLCAVRYTHQASFCEMSNSVHEACMHYIF